MSFVPVLYYQFRCDGDLKSGQCETLYTYRDDEADELVTSIYDKPQVDPSWVIYLESAGWIVVGKPGAQRLLCPLHATTAGTYLASTIDGLPFEEAS
jgi:hypothetical protein